MLLNNGAMYRGTISELVPGDHVVILVVGGDKKTFPIGDVKYAGPASNMPTVESAPPPEPAPAPDTAQPVGPPPTQDGKAKPMVTVHAREARLQLVSTPPGITFQRRTGSAIAVGGNGSAIATGYDDLCTAPCDVSIPAGTYTIALAKTGGSSVEAEPVVIPAGESTVRGEYVSKSGTRTAGLVVMVIGEAAGLGIIAAGDVHSDSTFILGLGVMGVGLGVGLALMYQSDKAVITVVPGASAALHPRLVAGADLDRLSAPGAGALPGLSVAARF